MKGKGARKPRCIVIAGPNGAGKTTFAREFLPTDAGIVHFVNADLIAGGLSPLRPELAAFLGDRIFLAELDRLAGARVDFAFETTLSGLAYLRRLREWKAAGYRIEITYLPCHQHHSRYAASPRAFAKAVITFRAKMLCAGLRVVGQTLSNSIVRLHIPGQYMIIPLRRRVLLNRAHEEN